MQNSNYSNKSLTTYIKKERFNLELDCALIYALYNIKHLRFSAHAIT